MSEPVAEVVAAVQSTATEAPPAAKPKKICCACPETRKVRDECVTHNGEDACAESIEKHKLCLRAEGFNVRSSSGPIAVVCIRRPSPARARPAGLMPTMLSRNPNLEPGCRSAAALAADLLLLRRC